MVAQPLTGEVPADRYVVLRRFHPDGTEDTTFESLVLAARGVPPPDGVGEGSQPAPGRAFSAAGGIAIDDAGRIIVAGDSEAGMTVWRLGPDGSPDNAFGVEGAVSRNNADPGYHDSGSDVAIDEAGRVIVGGTTYIHGGLAMGSGVSPLMDGRTRALARKGGSCPGCRGRERRFSRGDWPLALTPTLGFWCPAMPVLVQWSGASCRTERRTSRSAEPDTSRWKNSLQG